MERKKASDFDQGLLDLYDGYVHGKLSKRGFLKGAAKFAIGGVCNALAVAYENMKCSVPFYGRQASAADVPAIKAPLLLHYAGLDARINGGWPAYEAALKAHGKTFEAHIYDGVNHGFHNDTTPRYDAAAAHLAWARTLGWFEKHLS